MECLIREEIVQEASAVEAAMTSDNRPKRKSRGEAKKNPLSDVVQEEEQGIPLATSHLMELRRNAGI
jgi:hypothetical protein